MAETEKSLEVRQTDLNALAEGMEVASRGRALEKILSHYNRMGDDIGVLSRTVALQAETIAGLEKRLASLEATLPKREPAKSADENKAGASRESGKRLPFAFRR